MISNANQTNLALHALLMDDQSAAAVVLPLRVEKNWPGPPRICLDVDAPITHVSARAQNRFHLQPGHTTVDTFLRTVEEKCPGARNDLKTFRQQPGEELTSCFTVAGDGSFRVIDLVIRVAQNEDTAVALFAMRGRSQGNQLRSPEVMDTIQELSDTGVWVFDVATKRAQLSDQVFRIFGLDRQTAMERYGGIERAVLAATHPDDLEKVRQAGESLRSSLHIKRLGYRIRRLSDRQLRYIDNHGRIISDASGQPVRVVGFVRDVTEEHKLQAELIRSLELQEHAVSIANLGVAHWDFRTGRVVWNSQLHDIARIPRAEFRETLEEMLSIWHPDDLPSIRHCLRVLQDNKPMRDLRLRVVRPDGEVRYVNCEVWPLLDAKGQIAKAVSVIVDVTDETRDRAELEVRHKQLHGLAVRLQEHQHNQDRELARELHDDLAQTLVAVQFKLSERFGEDPDPELLEMQATLDQCVNTLRDVTARLRPPLLDALGIVSALQWEVDQIRRSDKLDISLEVNDSVKGAPRATPESEQAVIQVFRAATQSSKQDAADGDVRVHLRLEDDAYVLTVTDHAPPRPGHAKQSARGVDLYGLKERLESVNGSLHFEPVEGGGDAVVARVPLTWRPKKTDSTPPI